MSWISILAVILLVLASGITGSLVLMYRAMRMRAREEMYGLTTPYLRHLGAGIGAAAGLIVGLLIVYFASQTSRFDLIEWIGRCSYMLVAGATGGHLLVLAYTAIRLAREERAWGDGGRPRSGTLGARRMDMLGRLKREHKHFIDLKSRDDEVLDDLTGMLGGPLLNTRNDLARIPFYGYLGTVCGILLMAQELGHISEATETFKVLSSMANGLVLAFKTTLIALLAYLPLRKVTDYLIRRLGRLERYIGIYQFWPLAKLQLALSLFWFYFFFSAFIVFWYGRTTAGGQAIELLVTGPYWWAFVATFCLNFLIPMWTLMWNKVRVSILGPTVIAGGIILGTLIDRIRIYAGAWSTEGINDEILRVIPATVWPDAYDIFVIVGAIAAAALLFLAVTRFIPTVSLWEIQYSRLISGPAKFGRGNVEVVGKPD